MQGVLRVPAGLCMAQLLLTAAVPPVEHNLGHNSCRLHTGTGTFPHSIRHCFLGASRWGSFLLALLFLGVFSLFYLLPQTEVEITRNSEAAHEAPLFVFLPVHRSNAATLNTHFIFPGGEGDAMRDTFTSVNCNQS